MVSGISNMMVSIVDFECFVEVFDGWLIVFVGIMGCGKFIVGKCFV